MAGSPCLARKARNAAGHIRLGPSEHLNLMSLNMLIETPAGFDYTGAACAAWMEESGFRNVRIEPLQGAYSMAVGRK